MVTQKQFKACIFSMKGFSKKMVEEHLKLYQGYVNKYNEILEKLTQLTDDDYAKANQTYSAIRELKVELSFAWNGIVNHELYFSHLGGNGETPKGTLMRQIKKDFGSLELFKKDLKATALAARGWVWTGWNERTKTLFNYVSDAHNLYSLFEVKPVLMLDTYEHAYFMDYGSARGTYVDSFLNNLDWSIVRKNFESV